MVQKYVDKALTNPLFHAGINLLSIDDARQGPKAALQGLLAGKEVQQQMAQQKQAQAEAERKKAALAALGQQMPGLQPYIGTGLEGQAMTMLGQQAKQPKYRQLSPEEVVALGLPKGGVYQQDQTGAIKPVYEPPKSSIPDPVDTEQLGGALALQRDMEEFAKNPELFKSATGMLQGTGVGGFFNRAMGDRESEVARRKLQRISSSAVLDAASNLKGAASDRDIDLIRETAPSTTDDPDVWIDWYNNDVVPRLNFHYQNQYGITPFKAIEMGEQANTESSEQSGRGRNNPSAQRGGVIDWGELK